MVKLFEHIKKKIRIFLTKWRCFLLPWISSRLNFLVRIPVGPRFRVIYDIRVLRCISECYPFCRILILLWIVSLFIDEYLFSNVFPAHKWETWIRKKYSPACSHRGESELIPSKNELTQYHGAKQRERETDRERLLISCRWDRIECNKYDIFILTLSQLQNKLNWWSP